MHWFWVLNLLYPTTFCTCWLNVITRISSRLCLLPYLTGAFILFWIISRPSPPLFPPSLGLGSLAKLTDWRMPRPCYVSEGAIRANGQQTLLLLYFLFYGMMGFHALTLHLSFSMWLIVGSPRPLPSCFVCVSFSLFFVLSLPVGFYWSFPLKKKKELPTRSEKQVFLFTHSTLDGQRGYSFPYLVEVSIRKVIYRTLRFSSNSKDKAPFPGANGSLPSSLTGKEFKPADAFHFTLIIYIFIVRKRFFGSCL